MKPSPFTVFFVLAITFVTSLSIVIGTHAPLSDDLSMIAFSREWSWDWLNKGLADYFIVYPEYYGPQSNFIRPISNISYWLFGTVFKADYPFLANKMQLLVLTYGMLIAFSTLVGVLLSKVYGSRSVTALGFVSSLLIPTFWTTPSPTYTSFVFDGLAITFCLIALTAVWRHQFITMTICLALALMTKEIAFPVILGFILAFVIKRDGRGLFGCGIAIAAFALLRLNGFGLHAQGVYVFDSNAAALADLILDKARNIFTLPFGPVNYDEIKRSTGVNLFNRSGALLLINISLYVIISTLIARLYKHFSVANLWSGAWIKNPLDMRFTVLLISTFAAIISFAFDAYVGANYRYAFNFLPFLFISLAGAQLSKRAKQAVFSILLLGSLLGSAPSIVQLVKGSEFELFRYQVVRAFFVKIRANHNAKPVVVLNDFVLAYANPRAIEILAPTSSPIVRGTSLYLDSCKLSELSTIETRIERKDFETRVTVVLPDCGRFAFESAPKLPEFVAGNTIRRNDQIYYEFSPNSQRNHLSVAGWSGRDLTIVTRDADLLYFDFIDRTWKLVTNGTL